LFSSLVALQEFSWSFWLWQSDLFRVGPISTDAKYFPARLRPLQGERYSCGCCYYWPTALPIGLMLLTKLKTFVTFIADFFCRIRSIPYTWTIIYVVTNCRKRKLVTANRTHDVSIRSIADAWIMKVSKMWQRGASPYGLEGMADPRTRHPLTGLPCQIWSLYVKPNGRTQECRKICSAGVSWDWSLKLGACRFTP